MDSNRAMMQQRQPGAGGNNTMMNTQRSAGFGGESAGMNQKLLNSTYAQ